MELSGSNVRLTRRKRMQPTARSLLLRVTPSSLLISSFDMLGHLDKGNRPSGNIGQMAVPLVDRFYLGFNLTQSDQF